MTSEGKKSVLRDVLRSMESVIVAYSGGVDSALVAFVAHQELGDRMLAVTAVSDSVAGSDLQHAARFAGLHRLPYRTVHTAEIEDPRYAANPTNRCFFCKNELYARLSRLREELGFRHIADGSHADDDASDRPGMEAARRHQVRSPLREAGMGKDQVRTMARELGLEVWDRPASPCLSSRVPHGTAITPEVLHRIEAAEQVLRDLGFRIFRVRHHDRLARIELAADEMPRFLDVALFQEINRRFRDAGYSHVTLDLAGYGTPRLVSGETLTQIA